MTLEEGKESFPSPFGRYTLTERLALGGMAEVFKAKITSTHGFEKLLVIKRILPQLAADRTFVSMFIDEAKLTAQLIHPKIVQVIDFGEVKGQYFIALEFIDGFDALALLRGSASKHVRLPAPICMFIAMEVLDALDYAHQAKDTEGRPMRLVHRDISPSNVFLARRGDVKLGDFGIAHAQERESKTQAGTLKGKYGYMSPEQVMGATLDGRSDLFAVGIVLAEMLMGRRLFSAANDLDVLLMVRDGRLERLDKYARDLPAGLDHIVRKALARKVDERFQSAAEFRDALADLLFQSRMRVSPSDLGRISADFLDPAPDAAARAAEQCKRWEMRPAPAGFSLQDDAGSRPSHPPLSGQISGPISNATPVLGSPPVSHAIPVSGLGSSPSSAPSSFRRASSAVNALPAPPTTRPEVHPEEEPIEIELDEPPVPAHSSPKRMKADPAAAARLDQLLARPLSVVDLDKYEAPSASRGAGAGGRAPAPSAGHQTQATATADLAVMSPLRIFCDLAVGGETGLLRLEAASHTRDVHLAHGHPAGLLSSNAAENFAETLVASGTLRHDQMQAAQQQRSRFGGRLPDALVALGLASEDDVTRLMSEHVRGRIIELLALSQGRASFFRGARNPEETTQSLHVDSFELMGAGVVALPLETLRHRFVPLLDQRPAAATPPRVDPEAFQLGPTPHELWAMLDGSRTVREWLAGLPSQDEQMTFLRTLYLLTETGLASIQ